VGERVARGNCASGGFPSGASWGYMLIPESLSGEKLNHLNDEEERMHVLYVVYIYLQMGYWANEKAWLGLKP